MVLPSCEILLAFSFGLLVVVRIVLSLALATPCLCPLLVPNLPWHANIINLTVMFTSSLPNFIFYVHLQPIFLSCPVSHLTGRRDCSHGCVYCIAL